MKDAERATAIGFDPLRTRLVFLGQLPARTRAEFRRVIGDALEKVPSPAVSDGHFERLHRIWMAARRRAFRKVLATLDESDG
jgi:hypothetical protein